MDYTLYSYFRSSASWRVRIGLALKGLPADYRGVHLLRKDHEHETALGPAHLVPVLVTPQGERLTQSLAILEYLDECHPEPPLLPPDAVGRARARSLALDIACEIHPLNNLRVLRHLVHELQQTEAQKLAWMQHWMGLGLQVLEARLRDEGPACTFAMGEAPGLVDCLLVPQLFNARRFEVPLDALPTLRRIEAACLAHPAFVQTHPGRMPDAE